jgi:hemoglobin
VTKLGLLVLSMIALTACGATAADKAAAPATKPQLTLFGRLGGKDGIKVVVDDFVANIAADDAIKARFANTDVPAFKQKLVDQICQATGGPCTYTGKSMKDAHAGMRISDAEFGALVADLKKALDKNHVAPDAENDLLAALGGMHNDIVNQ